MKTEKIQTESISEKLAKDLSSFVDGELANSEAIFMSKRLCGCSESKERWTRYHLVGELIRGQATLCDRGFCNDLSLRLAQETQIGTAPGAWKSTAKWLKPASGVAIAASVAVLAVVTLMQKNPGASDQIIPPGLSIPAINLQSQIQPASASYSIGAQRTRLNRYLIRHNQSGLAGRGVAIAPYVYVVSNTRPVVREKIQEDKQ